MKISSLTELLRKSAISGSRSTILQPNIWLLTLVSIILFLLVFTDAPDYLIYIFTGIFILGVFVFFGVFVYCLFTDKDAIRSEKYSLSKLAIKRGIYGDSATGVYSTNQLLTLSETLDEPTGPVEEGDEE